MSAVDLARLVRPLVWKAHPSGLSTIDECAIADAPFSQRYQVQRDPWAHSYLSMLHPRLPITESTLWWESKGHADLAAAQAAANADHAARVISALDADLLAELVGALQRYYQSGCPDCRGDCGSANPPVSCCLPQEARAILAKLEAKP